MKELIGKKVVMKRILFLIPSFCAGGAERQLILLASGLHQAGYSVKIAVFYSGGILESEAKATVIQIVNLGRGPWDQIPFLFRLVRLIRSERPDILHSYLSVPNVWAAFVKLLNPRTKVIWGIRISGLPLKKYGLRARLDGRIETLLSGIPDWIICNSHAGMLHALEKGYPKEKMSVVPNGIDTQMFFPDRKSGLKLREQWKIAQNEKLIGMVGRMDPVKDYPNFLRAASLLVQERLNIRFVCVGCGPDQYVQEYRELAGSLHLEPFLVWAGEQENMFSVYNALDLLVLSSNGEGFSNVITEAMACGVPCVATNVGDAAQLIGALGEIVPPGDSEALKRSILALLNRLEVEEASLKNEVARRIADQFSTANLIFRTADILNRVLPESSVSGSS